MSDRTSVIIIIMMLGVIVGCTSQTRSGFDSLVCLGFCQYAEASTETETNKQDDDDE